MSLTLQEMETHLNMTADDRNTWHVCSDDPVMQRRLEAVGAELVRRHVRRQALQATRRPSSHTCGEKKGVGIAKATTSQSTTPTQSSPQYCGRRIGKHGITKARGRLLLRTVTTPQPRLGSPTGDYTTMTSLLISDQMNTIVMPKTVNQLYWDGFYAYCEGQQLEDMPTKAQRDGWWAALDAQAGCEMPVAKKVVHVDEAGELEDYQEDMLDRDFWARGQW